MEVALEFCGKPNGPNPVVRARGEFVLSFATMAEAEAFMGRVEALREREGLLLAEAIAVVLRHPSMTGTH